MNGRAWVWGNAALPRARGAAALPRAWGTAALALALALLLLFIDAPAHAQGPAACPPLPTVDDSPPRDRGLLWKLTRDGRSSYLFGTLHTGRPGWERFGPATAAALRATDVLALEVDPTDPATLSALAAPLSAPNAVALPEHLRQRLARAYDRACLPAGALAALHPLLQANVLSLGEARWLGLDAAFGQETLLAAHTRAAGRRVRALETVAQQWAALLPADPADSTTLIAQTLDQIDDGATRRVLARLVEVWSAGDLATLERYGAWCECAPSAEEQALMQRLNDGRNPGLADGIAALHGQGQRVFAAVGALHMTGAQALPRLLAERGFRVDRVAFSR